MAYLILILLWLFLEQSFSFNLTIVHSNDMHGRYYPIAKDGGPCKEGDDEKGLCYGGFARVATVVDQARAKGAVIYLIAGDTYKGISKTTPYKAPLAGELINLLAPDALALGHSELDDNIVGLVHFLDEVKYPVVACNMETHQVPELRNTRKFLPYTIITKFNTKIAIVGYITPDTKNLAPKNKLIFTKEKGPVNHYANRLARQGARIVIALGHSGYEMDKYLAENCPEVDVVVGGHSHTFLYTGQPPDSDKPVGPYPTVVTKKITGTKVPVVQAYAFTKYLGKIDLEFDDYGNLTRFSGAPILLDKNIMGRADIKALLESKGIPEVDSSSDTPTKDNYSSTVRPDSTESISTRAVGEMLIVVVSSLLWPLL